MAQETLRFINFISGGGSTNLAVLEAERPGNQLDGLTKTVAIISSDPQATGIRKAIDAGFPAGEVMSVKPAHLAEQLLEIMDYYRPDYFHQLGWMPKTPDEVIARYRGLNQHFGPGGKLMYGERRAYAYRRFSEMVGEERGVPVFCQRVAPNYDSGDIVYMCWTNICSAETPEEASKRILDIEHQVQIEARRRLALGDVNLTPVPSLARNEAEEELLLLAKNEARVKYPAH